MDGVGVGNNAVRARPCTEAACTSCKDSGERVAVWACINRGPHLPMGREAVVPHAPQGMNSAGDATVAVRRRYPVPPDGSRTCDGDVLHSRVTTASKLGASPRSPTAVSQPSAAMYFFLWMFYPIRAPRLRGWRWVSAWTCLLLFLFVSTCAWVDYSLRHLRVDYHPEFHALQPLSWGRWSWTSNRQDPRHPDWWLTCNPDIAPCARIKETLQRMRNQRDGRWESRLAGLGTGVPKKEAVPVKLAGPATSAPKKEAVPVKLVGSGTSAPKKEIVPVASLGSGGPVRLA